MNEESSGKAFAFDDFVLDGVRRRLTRGGAAVRISSKTFDLLEALVSRPGETVTRQELLQRVWPDVHVEDGNLAVNVCFLRRALGDDRTDPRLLVTVPGRGYRFCATVREVEADAVEAPSRRPAFGARSETAREACLKGRYIAGRRTEDAMLCGLSYFERAIERDPGYAPAYAGVADSYTLLSGYSDVPAKEGYARACAWASRAIEQDPGLVEGYTALAYASFNRGELGAAGDSFERALGLDDAHPATLHWHADTLFLGGSIDGSLTQMRRARRADPLSAVIATDLGRTYLLAGELQHAEESVHEAIELDPGFVKAWWVLGQTRLQSGRVPDALKAFRRALKLGPESQLVLGSLAHALGVARRRREAEAVLERLAALSARRYVDPYWLALGSLGLRRRRAALGYLEAAARDGSHWLLYAGVEPTLAPLRDEPRFRELLSLRAVGPS